MGSDLTPPAHEPAAPPSDDAHFTALIARCRTQEEALAAVGRDAAAILARREQEARDAADRILIEARRQAARLLTEARHEIAALSAQVDSLRRAQRDAALALRQTRAALDGALGASGVRPPDGRAPRAAGARVSRRSRLPRPIWIVSGAAVAVAVIAAAAGWTVPRATPAGAAIAKTDAGSGAASPSPAPPRAAAAVRRKAPPVKRTPPAADTRSAGASATARRAPIAGTAGVVTGINPASRAVGTPVVLKPPPPSTRAGGGGAAAPARRSTESRPLEAALIEQQILAADRAWFAAHYRGDRTGMSHVSAEGFALADARAREDRPAGGAPPERLLRDVRIDVHGDGAVLSGRMIERVPAAERTVREHESFVSEVWVRRDGVWRLLGLRLASADQVREAAGPLR